MNILIINGPNLNMLGIREKDIYGKKTYGDLVNFIKDLGKKLNLELQIHQTNNEAVVINLIQQAYYTNVDAIIINPAAFTHYSYAIYDAIKAVNIRTIEVHLTNINEREDFRKINVIKDACEESFMGEGFMSYQKALEYLVGEK